MIGVFVRACVHVCVCACVHVCVCVLIEVISHIMFSGDYTYIHTTMIYSFVCCCGCVYSISLKSNLFSSVQN